MTIVLLIFMALFPVFLIGLILYKVDKERESLKSILLFYTLGLFSAFIASVLEGIFYLKEADLFSIFLDCFVFIALIEELAKFLCATLGTKMTKSYDNFYDSIVFCTAVSLGFAGIENVLYVFRSRTISVATGVGVGFLRALLAVPGHVVFAVFMGYFLDKKVGHKYQGKSSAIYGFLAIFIPILLHGLYDFFCLTLGIMDEPIYYIIFCVYILFLYISGIVLIVKSAKRSHIRFDGSNDTTFIYRCFNCSNALQYTVCKKCGVDNTQYIEAINKYYNYYGKYPDIKSGTFNICSKCGNFSEGYFCNKCGNVLK